MTQCTEILSTVRRRTIWKILLYSSVVAVYSLAPVIKEYSHWHEFWDFPSNLHATLSLVLGCLLVFRTNTSHSRWWEARTLWGALVNASRNLAAKFSQLVELPSDEVAEARRDLIGFAHALRDHLRVNGSTLRRPIVEGEMVRPNHLPAFIVRRRYAALRRWKRRGFIDGDELRVIDADLARLLDVCGACERIRNTRVVRSYRRFARQSVLLFLITFPWGIVNDFGWWTIPISFVTAYFMLGLEIVAEHVEEPFGNDEDDLDLDRICLSISQSVEEIMSTEVGDSGDSAEVLAASPKYVAPTSKASRE
jgi:putative membrane protein